jgi:hypothetical protein
MQAVAAELAGYAGKFRCFLERKIKNSFFRFIYFNLGGVRDAFGRRKRLHSTPIRPATVLQSFYPRFGAKRQF